MQLTMEIPMGILDIQRAWKLGGPDPALAGFVVASNGGYGVPNADGIVNGPIGYVGYGTAGG